MKTKKPNIKILIYERVLDLHVKDKKICREEINSEHFNPELEYLDYASLRYLLQIAHAEFIGFSKQFNIKNYPELYQLRICKIKQCFDNKTSTGLIDYESDLKTIIKKLKNKTDLPTRREKIFMVNNMLELSISDQIIAKKQNRKLKGLCTLFYIDNPLSYKYTLYDIPELINKKPKKAIYTHYDNYWKVDHKYSYYWWSVNPKYSTRIRILKKVLNELKTQDFLL